MKQEILFAKNEYKNLDIYLQKNSLKNIMIVCGSSYKQLGISDYFENITSRLGINVLFFSDFQPNPVYESVEKGIALFKKNKCDSIIAIGGGSAMDVAKCIKLFSNMDSSINYLTQKIIPNDIKYLAVPTTAGTGSEATKYAVIYYEGEKQSISDDSCIPSAVLFDSSLLKTLPLYQKKSTVLDALCHSIESFWSINSTEESKVYSRKALDLILENLESYLANEDSGNEKMLLAANYAGKAINITQTTAGHAMCYKLTSLYKIAHGHAAALCVKVLWEYMIENLDLCIDSRGKEYLKEMLIDIAKTMNCQSIEKSFDKYNEILRDLSLPVPEVSSSEEYNILNSSVNHDRLKNHPIKLSKESLEMLYHQILDKRESV